MAFGSNVALCIGLGGATMKYNPPVNEAIVRSAKVAETHPFQNPSTLQGILGVIYEFEQYLKAISGMARFTFQPGGGSQAILGNALIVRAYHRSRGEAEQRDEIITTILSHPAAAAAPATAGFKIVTLRPGPMGYPELDAVRAAVSERTAGLVITNPEDTGIFNPNIGEFVELVHAKGGLCVYDQANLNGVLGVTRARDLGFDLTHFNLHKTFAVPHGSMGGAVGAIGVREGLERFLPVPLVVREDSGEFAVEWDQPESIGTLRSGFGNVHSVIKAFAWAAMMGADGLREAAHVAVLNSNYAAKRVAAIRGADIAFGENDARRLEQARYTWEELARETGVGTVDVHDRMSDFGVVGHYTSHLPWLVSEPFTLEPAESYSQEEIDEVLGILEQISADAYAGREGAEGAPHRNASDASIVSDAYSRPATTWRAFLNTRAPENR
jgi:glycine dehydrogenase subunit 2